MATLATMAVPAAAATCVARSGEFALRTAHVEERQELLYKGKMTAVPRSGGRTMKLCAGQRYQIIPIGKTTPCILTIPTASTAAELGAAVDTAMRAIPPRCKRPTLRFALPLDGDMAGTRKLELRGKFQLVVDRERSLTVFVMSEAAVPTLSPTDPGYPKTTETSGPISNPPTSNPPFPVSLVAAGTATGLAGGALLGGFWRRRDGDVTNDDSPTGTATGANAGDLSRIRPMPYIPSTAGPGPVSGWLPLAAVFGCDSITPGALLSALEVAAPAVIAWSRSGEAGAIPPARLAAALLAKLPHAMPASLAELIAALPKSSLPGYSLENYPAFQVLDDNGVPIHTINFEANLTLTPPAIAVAAAEKRLVDWLSEGILLIADERTGMPSVEVARRLMRIST